jgi:hypothetical protein
VIGNEARNRSCQSMNHQRAELVRSVDMGMNWFRNYSKIDTYRTNRNTYLSNMNFSNRVYLRGLAIVLNFIPTIGLQNVVFLQPWSS